MNVLALDLSLTGTGRASTDGKCGLVVTAADQCIESRIVTIVDSVREELRRFEPDVIAIEDLPPTRAFNTAPLGMLHGALRVLLFRRNLAFALIPPSSLKKYATGKGLATKPDMRMALYKRKNLDLVDDNLVDAWWLMAMAADHYGHPIVELPKTHRDALAKVAWP